MENTTAVAFFDTSSGKVTYAPIVSWLQIGAEYVGFYILPGELFAKDCRDLEYFLTYVPFIPTWNRSLPAEFQKVIVTKLGQIRKSPK